MERGIYGVGGCLRVPRSCACSGQRHTSPGRASVLQHAKTEDVDDDRNNDDDENSDDADDAGDNEIRKNHDAVDGHTWPPTAAPNPGVWYYFAVFVWFIMPYFLILLWEERQEGRYKRRRKEIERKEGRKTARQKQRKKERKKERKNERER